MYLLQANAGRRPEKLSSSHPRLAARCPTSVCTLIGVSATKYGELDTGDRARTTSTAITHWRNH
jgi:hypothetical protein